MAVRSADWGVIAFFVTVACILDRGGCPASHKFSQYESSEAVTALGARYGLSALQVRRIQQLATFPSQVESRSNGAAQNPIEKTFVHSSSTDERNFAMQSSSIVTASDTYSETDMGILYNAIYAAIHFEADTITQTEARFPPDISLNYIFDIMELIRETDEEIYGITDSIASSCYKTNVQYGVTSEIATIKAEGITPQRCQLLCRLMNRSCRFFTLVSPPVKVDQKVECRLARKQDAWDSLPGISTSGPLICDQEKQLLFPGYTYPSPPPPDSDAGIAQSGHLTNPIPFLTNSEHPPTEKPLMILLSDFFHLDIAYCANLCRKHKEAALDPTATFDPSALGPARILLSEPGDACFSWEYHDLPVPIGPRSGLCKLYAAPHTVSALPNNISAEIQKSNDLPVEPKNFENQDEMVRKYILDESINLHVTGFLQDPEKE